MDNCSFHTNDYGKMVEVLLKEKNSKLILLPAYSPELNPVELVFSYLKKKLQNYNVNNDIRTSFIEALESIDKNKLINYYMHCGYLN